MILAIDISNNHIVMGALEDGRCVSVCRMATVKSRTADEFSVLMGLMAQQHRVSLDKMEGCIISSVVPELTSVLKSAAAQLCGKPVMVVGPGVKTGLNIRLDDPSELASDFVATAVAAHDRYPLPCAIVNMDTAVAIGLLDRNGCYIGGCIGAGVMASNIALSRGASQLHSVVVEAPGRVIGRNTVDSMRSGIVYGTAAMVDGLLTGVDEEVGERVNVVATGEWADRIVPHCRRVGIVLDKDLAMHGLWLIYQKNKNK